MFASDSFFSKELPHRSGCELEFLRPAKSVTYNVDVNFDICYRPCMVPFPEIPKQDPGVPRLVNLQQQLYLLIDFSSFYGKLHDLVTLSSLFRNLNQRRI
jgi:hypothetical protein